MACAGCGDISYPHRFGSVPLELLAGRLDELDRRRATEWFKPQPPVRINMASGCVAAGFASGVGQDDHREFKALRLVDGHQAHALRTFLNNRRFDGLTALGITL